MTSPPQRPSPELCIAEQPTWTSTPPGLNPTPRERQIFHLLRTLTVHQVDGGVQSGFWSKNLLQATYVYPAIWHAALALSAMHQRAILASNEAEAHFADEYHTFALKQYTASIGHVISMKAHDKLSTSDQEMLLTASALYTGISLLRGDLDQAQTHANNAVKLFCQWGFLDDEEDVDTGASGSVLGRQHTSRLIRDIFYSFVSLGDRFPEELELQFVSSVPHITKPFESLDAAYYAYLPIHTGLLRIKSWEPENVLAEEVTPPTSNMLERQHGLNLWNVRFEGYLQLQTYTEEDLDVIALLQMLRMFEETFGAIMIHRTPQMWIKHAHKWDRIVKAAEHLIEKQERNGSSNPSISGGFSFSISALEVLRMVGFICRSGSTRRRIVSLLKQWSKRDAAWDNRLSWVMVEAKMLVEEQSLAAAPPGSCECVPDIFFCTEHRVSSVNTDFLQDGVVVVKMKTGAEARQNLLGHTWSLKYDC